MSKHNYTQYSNKKNENYVAPVAEEEVIEAVVEPTVQPEPEVVEAPETLVVETETATETATVTGTVTNCAKLNVRASASATAAVVCILDAASEIEINVEKSNAEWFSVCTATGIEGYCMRKFIQADL